MEGVPFGMSLTLREVKFGAFEDRRIRGVRNGSLCVRRPETRELSEKLFSSLIHQPFQFRYRENR